ncbi:hypothetical protein AAC387_Pa03g2624 [Persea americana]
MTHPRKETDRLREEVQRTLGAAGIAAVALTSFESNSSVVGVGVPRRLRSADCKRFRAKGLGAFLDNDINTQALSPELIL